MAPSGNVLDKILEMKKGEVERLKREMGAAELRRRAAGAPPVRDFLKALQSCPRVPVIAEIKKASPSRGPIREGADAAAMAKKYRDGGAAAISVLTDRRFFGGSLDDLASARGAVEIPVLRKDFMIDAVQLFQARAAGADAVLLIAATLAPGRLADLIDAAGELGMIPLVEVHDERELESVLRFDPPLLGINNRNLHTLEVSLETCAALRKKVPSGVFVVGESGIEGPDDIRRLRAAGIDGFLVGTRLMVSDDPRAELARLCGSDGGG